MSPSTPQPIVHLELHTDDLPTARDLYAELCGWRPALVETGHGTYQSLGVGPPLGGGIVASSIPRPVWLPYVEVAEIGAATERAVGLGATLALAPREGPAGWRSVITTAAGGAVAFWQPKR